VQVAVTAVREDIARHGAVDVTFACFDAGTLELYRQALIRG